MKIIRLRKIKEERRKLDTENLRHSAICIHRRQQRNFYYKREDYNNSTCRYNISMTQIRQGYGTLNEVCILPRAHRHSHKIQTPNILEHHIVFALDLQYLFPLYVITFCTLIILSCHSTVLQHIYIQVGKSEVLILIVVMVRVRVHGHYELMWQFANLILLFSFIELDWGGPFPR